MFVENTTSATVGSDPAARADSPLPREMRPRKRVPSSRRRNPGVLVASLKLLAYRLTGGVAAGGVAEPVVGAAPGATVPGAVGAGSSGIAGVAGAALPGSAGAAAGAGVPHVSSRIDLGARFRVDIT